MQRADPPAVSAGADELLTVSAVFAENRNTPATAAELALIVVIQTEAWR